MIISFQTQALRDACQSRASAEQAFGPKVSERLFGLLADLEAAEDLGEVLSFCGADAHCDEADSLSICFGPEPVVRFKPVGEILPLNADLNVDWNRLRRLKLISIATGA